MSVYVGLMSGTSLDGISAAVVRFSSAGIPDTADTVDTVDLADTANATRAAWTAPIHADLLAFITAPYSAEQRERLQRAMSAGTAQDYCRLNFDLGSWLADAAVAVLAEAGVPRAEIRAIGSHGQTLWHDAPHSTWQIGEAAVIAERTGIEVVSDFRVGDVAAGGQGAPLVPIADALLFSGDEWRALQNIGGIGNVTVVPPGGALSGVRGFDTGPGVAVIDAVVRTLMPELSYDAGGALAAAGQPVDVVVSELLAHPYFAAEPPKSTGRELFDSGYVSRLIARCREDRPRCSDADIIATATSLTARSIADAYRRFLPEPVTEVLLSGGGAKNTALVDMIAAAVDPLPVKQFADRYFDGEAKEAVAFALLAYLNVNEQTGNIPRVTGARGPRRLGKRTPAR